MRKYHRWVSVLAALFLLVVSATGVILQVQKLTGTGGDADQSDAARTESTLSTAMSSPSYAGLISRTLDAARARAPNAPVNSVSIRVAGDQIQGVVAFPGDPPRQIVVDPRSGRILSDERRDPDSLVKRIHSGAIFGQPGVVMGILWGSALFVLSITGGWMYLSMHRKRRKASGKGDVFW